MGAGGYSKEEELNKLRNKKEELINANSNLSVKVLELSNRIEMLTNEKSILSQQNNKITNEKKDLIRDNKELNEKVIQYQADIEKLNESKELLQKEVEKVNKEKNELEEATKENVKLKQENEQLRKEIEELRRKYEKANEEKVFIEKERDNLIKENNNLKYSKMIFEESNLFLNKISNKEIELTIKKKYKEFLKDKINNDQEDEQADFLLKNEIFKKKINEQKENILGKSINEFLKQSNHINIILLGKTGVGKSTLINALLGRNAAETGGFVPVTDKSTYYETNLLRLWDTVGIELTEERNSDKILGEIKKIITDSEKKEPDWFIHCIWYCIRGSRFELKEEGKIIDELLNTYKDGKMPLIIVYLQAYEKEAINQMECGIKRKFKNIDFMPVIAKEIKSINGMITEPFGLDELKRRTISRIGDTINSMSFVHVQNMVKQKISNNIEKLSSERNLNALSKSVYELYKKLIGNLDENDKNEIEENVKKILQDCKEIDFSDEISNYIKQFKEDISKNKNNYNENNESRSENNARKNKKQLKKIENTELLKIIERIQKELESRFNKCKNENNVLFNEEIYNYFLKTIKKYAKLVVEENLKNIKDELKIKMKEEINKSPNIQELLKNK